jgi:hypothetical protein
VVKRNRQVGFAWIFRYEEPGSLRSSTGCRYRRTRAPLPPPADIRRRGRRDLTSEQERVLLEHLPIVRFLARRIHERCPSMWISKTWSRPGVVG